VRASLIKHFAKHGAKMDARDLWQYLRKARTFSMQLKGVQPYLVAGDTPGVLRYRKLGKYIDVAPDGRTVSFGLVSKNGK